MGNILSQSYFIAEPALTEKNLPDLTGKVFIVTGGNSGCGFELVKLLYQKNGTVYVAGRSTERCTTAIEKIKAEFAESGGRLEFLKVDLGDLTTVPKAADEFMGKEQRLDVLWNNAGVMEPPKGSVTAQGYELQVGTNCLGHFLLTQLLHPILRQTAATSPANTVRVAWAGSLAIDFYTPNGGIDFDEKGGVKYESQKRSYGVSKAGNLFLASEFGKRARDEGIVSVVFNPGNLKSELQNHMSTIERYFVWYTMCYHARYGAYTELYAGLSPDLTTEHNGRYIAPWGRLGYNRVDIEASLKSEAEGGSGKAEQFWQYCERETKHASLKHTCPSGVYLSLTPGNPSLWAGVLFVRNGPYAPAILRFQISFPSTYPDLPPVITFTTDIFHPLLTPLTTYTYTTGSSDSDPVSATDEERLPPGGFSLRHGFPHWFQRAKRSAANSGTSSRNVSGSQGSQDEQAGPRFGMANSTLSMLGPSSRVGQPSADRSLLTGAIIGGGRRNVTIVEVLHYIRSAFTDHTALDSVPLEAAGNPGAWHAWRAHRRRYQQLSPSPSLLEVSDLRVGDGTSAAVPRSDQRTTRTPSDGVARQPGEWNWEGVWEERVRRGVEASQSEAVLYGHASSRDDLIRFVQMDGNLVEDIKQDMERSAERQHVT